LDNKVIDILDEVKLGGRKLPFQLEPELSKLDPHVIHYNILFVLFF